MKLSSRWNSPAAEGQRLHEIVPDEEARRDIDPDRCGLRVGVEEEDESSGEQQVVDRDSQSGPSVVRRC